MRASVYLGIFVVLVLGCGPSARNDGIDALPGTCTGMGQRCNGNALEGCQGDQWVHITDCPNACSPALGCVVCLPGTGTCNGDTATECRADGSGFHDVYCDPVQGMSCGASGTCTGACSPLALGETYFGCDYYPTVTGNMVSSFYDFAVAVANTAASEARITIDSGALTAPATFTVPAGSVVVRTLPWHQGLKLCLGGTSALDCQGMPLAALAIDGAFHLRSDVPVTVYQFSPLQYFKAGAPTNSYTNDASLLFPTNAWRDDHYVAAFNHTAGVFPSLLAVSAHQDATQVTITTTANTPAGGGAPAFVTGQPQTVVLNAGDVVELTTLTGDLTGSRVTSTAPVQVIGGHFCAYVPDDNWGYCDHLEEVMLPIDALGANYVISPPAVVSIPQGKEQVVKIIATQPNTSLTYDPPQPTFPQSIAAAGQVAVISRQTASYKLTANQKILVAQYMEGSTVAGNTGDPAMTLAVPVEQFRTQYLFHAPTNYQTNYVDITMPMGATVTLDGSPAPAPTAIGGSGWGVSRVTPLGNGPLNDGNHFIMGSAAFGITVYGYGMDTSYWYPGGLDLSRIVIE